MTGQKPGKEYDLSLIFNIFPRQVILNPHMLPVSSISGATGKKNSQLSFLWVRIMQAFYGARLFCSLTERML
ncbi:Uncharacterised protein [Klebsiella pneumoniae]|uniref:Uncharacterized protein n=1 Tax=Klebsiella pneumoniae TaxID=573 RepID=A0A2X3C6S0_KLEPN|nr:Uncharacterised protein [Klebsiella pneumoniae]